MCVSVCVCVCVHTRAATLVQCVNRDVNLMSVCVVCVPARVYASCIYLYMSA